MIDTYDNNSGSRASILDFNMPIESSSSVRMTSPMEDKLYLYRTIMQEDEDAKDGWHLE